ncbi:MAG TPA: hypothetical protein VG710_03210 [Opitutus sp.]|nr:hypothetical protein [Opitutus sp.]
MNATPVSPRKELSPTLDEDLQIVHATLAVLVEDVQQYSDDAREDIAAAMGHVHAAHDRLMRLQATER